MKFSLVMLIITALFGVPAHAEELQIKSVSIQDVHTDLSIPYVVAEDQQSVLPLNDFIFMRLAGVAAPKNWVKSYKAGENYGVDSRYTVITNDGKVLSLKIDGMSCGSSCWGANNFVNIDVKTALPINLEDLLQPKALKQLRKTFSKKLIKAINKWSKSGEGADIIGYKVALGETYHPDIDGFLIKNNKISIFGALDYKSYEFYEYVFDPNTQADVLTDYGQSVFAGENVDNSMQLTKNTPYGILLSGVIGQSPIKMKINAPYCLINIKKKEECNLYGSSYFYERFRNTIELNGVLTRPNQLTLTEPSGAVMTLLVNGTHLTGKWTKDKQVSNVDLGVNQ